MRLVSFKAMRGFTSKRFGLKCALRSVMTLAGTIWLMGAWLAGPAAAAAGEAMCKGLKPFNNLDELLYQFYINLDSDCLFTMQLEELEKIWGIRIFSWDRESANSSYYSVDDYRYHFVNKPFKAEKDAFYLTTYRGKDRAVYKGKSYTIEIAIRITDEYREKYATLFPDGNFPKLIPEPVKKLYHALPPPPREMTQPVTPPPKRPDNAGVYRMDSYSYYWLNSDQTHMISLEGDYGVTRILMWNMVPPFFRETRN